MATGDSRGKIILWRGVGEEASKLVLSTLHWHAHGVADLVFNSDGSYLVSGGEEAVLVIWQLQTGVKRFLPRLGTYASILLHFRVVRNPADLPSFTRERC